MEGRFIRKNDIVAVVNQVVPDRYKDFVLLKNFDLINDQILSEMSLTDSFSLLKSLKQPVVIKTSTEDKTFQDIIDYLNQTSKSEEVLLIDEGEVIESIDPYIQGLTKVFNTLNNLKSEYLKHHDKAEENALKIFNEDFEELITADFDCPKLLTFKEKDHIFEKLITGVYSPEVAKAEIEKQFIENALLNIPDASELSWPEFLKTYSSSTLDKEKLKLHILFGKPKTKTPAVQF